MIEVRELATFVFVVKLDELHAMRLRDERRSNETDADTLARLLGRSPL